MIWPRGTLAAAFSSSRPGWSSLAAAWQPVARTATTATTANSLVNVVLLDSAGTSGRGYRYRAARGFSGSPSALVGRAFPQAQLHLAADFSPPIIHMHDAHRPRFDDAHEPGRKDAVCAFPCWLSEAAWSASLLLCSSAGWVCLACSWNVIRTCCCTLARVG